MRASIGTSFRTSSRTSIARATWARRWQTITNGLPAGVYVHVVKEDPMRQGLLFAGTERGAFISFDDGETWQSLQHELPVTSMRDFEIYNERLDRRDARSRLLGRRRHRFAAADSRRRSLHPTCYLFKPSDSINVDQGGDNGTPLQKDEPQALNPETGAYIDYYLKRDATSRRHPRDCRCKRRGHAAIRERRATAGSGRPRRSPGRNSKHLTTLASDT